MTKQTEALKLALEALEWAEFLVESDERSCQDAKHSVDKAITAIREALVEQPAQQWTDETAKVPDHVWVTPKLRLLAKLAHEQQEPVAWVREHELPLAPGDAFSWVETFVHKTPIYTSPPAQRTWVGLTDEDVKKLIPPWDCWTYEVGHEEAATFARTIEAKLKEKNT